MQKIQFFTLALVCSISSVAFAKHTGTKITITGKDKQLYDKAIVTVAFESMKGNHVRVRDGVLTIDLKKGGTADLLKAKACRKGHMHRNCKSVVEEYYGGDAENVQEIYVKSIVVGPQNMYATVGSKMKGKASGSFVHTNSPHGTLKRNFVIEGSNINVKN